MPNPVGKNLFLLVLFYYVFWVYGMVLSKKTLLTAMPPFA